MCDRKVTVSNLERHYGSVIPEYGRMKQEDGEFKVSLGYTA
jgi:hypothetical protein